MWAEALRLFNLATVSTALGFALAVGWRLRRTETFPKYLKAMGVSYAVFCVFALVTTQMAFANDFPVTWRTWVGTLAGVSGVAAASWTWWRARR